MHVSNPQILQCSLVLTSSPILPFPSPLFLCSRNLDVLRRTRHARLCQGPEIPYPRQCNARICRNGDRARIIWRERDASLIRINGVRGATEPNERISSNRRPRGRDRKRPANSHGASADAIDGRARCQ